MRYAKTVTSDFYCLRCGRPGIPIARRESLQHEAHHRKKLYCPWCKLTVNHIECRTFAEIEEFKENFSKGVYKDEAEESLAFVGSSGQW